jgi:predicted TIM-barrel enzyme
VGVKHAAPLLPRPLAAEARDLEKRALADALLVTGPATGEPASLDELDEVREAVQVPVLTASGISPATAASVMGRCDGLIVGSALRRGGLAGAPVEEDRVRRFMEAARS